jgi:probable rRNA maturation factor
VSQALTLSSRQGARAVDLRFLRRIVHALLLELLRQEAFELSICLVASAEMTRVNEAFLGHKGSTDVITFDYGESALPTCGRRSRTAPHKLQKSPRSLLGEVLICVPDVLAQAPQFGTTWQNELIRCMVHGVLHLRGYNDHTSSGRRRMKREEDGLLHQLESRFELRKLALRKRAPTLNMVR